MEIYFDFCRPSLGKNLEYVRKSSCSSELKDMLDHFNSNFVIFRSYQKRVKCKVNINISYCCANSLLSLERKEYVKYLCVLFNSK